ncbi:MAG: spherulation-specific family 4 protein [Clostridiales bacterium]
MVLLLGCTSLSEIFATSSSTGILVPLYMLPNSTDWSLVIDVKGNHTSVPFVAIVNPNNGPDAGNCVKSPYQDGIQRLHEKGIIVLGYVYTQWGNRTLIGPNSVEDNIVSWKMCYPEINGIFLDEMNSSSASAGYYRAIYLFSKLENFSTNYIFGNPGQDTSPNLLGVVSTLNIFEDPGVLNFTDLTGANNWHEFYDKKNFSFLLFGNASTPSPSVIGNYSNYVSYLYVTDNTGNGHSGYNSSTAFPWNTTSTYLMQIAADLDKPSVPIVVNSVNSLGQPISGYYVHVSQSGNWIPSGFTPLYYNATGGIGYTFTANSFASCTFDHWKDTGSTNSSRYLVANSTGIQITAVYRNSTGVCA